MKKITVGLVIVFIALSLSGCKDKNNNKDEEKVVKKQEEASAKEEEKVKVDINNIAIYIATINNKEGGELDNSQNAGCEYEMFAVKTDKKLSPQEALETLLTYRVQDDGGNSYSTFSLSKGLKIEKMIVKNNFAVVTLSEDLIVKGLCDESIIYDQIRKTLLQFEEIDGVDIFVGDKELSEFSRMQTEVAPE